MNGRAKVIFLLPVFMVVAALAGCASQPPVAARVTVLHQLPASASYSQTYAFVEPKNDMDTLELRPYQDLVRQQLDRLGFREVPLKKADIAVALQYQVDTGQQIISTSPLYGPVNAGLKVNHDHFSVPPGYGVVGNQYNARTEYTRVLQVEMLKADELQQQKPGQLFKGRVVSYGGNPDINSVMPYMVKALFNGFPGRSGKTRDIVCRKDHDGIQCAPVDHD